MKPPIAVFVDRKHVRQPDFRFEAEMNVVAKQEVIFPHRHHIAGHAVMLRRNALGSE